MANYKVRLTSNGKTDSATAATLEGAMAVAKAFEVEQAGNPDAYTSIYELDGTNAGFGTCHHTRWLGQKFGPPDTRSPIERILRAQLRAGVRVTFIDEGDVWQVEPAGMDERYPARAA